MKLVAGTPFWPLKNKTPQAYPPLCAPLDTEILVVGGGITSALICLAFHRAGKQVALLCDSLVGHGSTSASTALLQYEIDVDLIDLAGQMGWEKAAQAYHLCGQAIDDLAHISKSFPADFFYRPSICLAAEQGDLEKLKEECAARKKAGFEVRWLSQGQLAEEFGFNAPGAICSRLGAEVDPYMLTQNIFSHLSKKGMPIYEQTEVVYKHKDGQKLHTQSGHPIQAKRAVFAGGYKAQYHLNEEVVNLHSSYAFVSNPLPEAQLWPQKALWWDTADPYLYARTTADNRMMVGGGDKTFWQAAQRQAVHEKQIALIAQKTRQYYPKAQWQIEHSWNGVFGETKDGLAYIGAPPEWENADFALGFGGNGITYSQLAATCLVKKYEGQQVDALELFRFGR